MGELNAAGGHPSGQPGTRAGSSLARAAIVLAVMAFAWFALNVERPRSPMILLWLPCPLSAAIAAAACWRASRTASLPAPTRRFWRHLSVTTTLVVIGALIRGWDTLSGLVPAQRMSLLSSCVFAGAVLTALWAMYRLPLGTSSGGERLRVGLDAGTVMLAAAVFLWHFVMKSKIEQFSGDNRWVFVSLLTNVLAAIAIFAVAKVILAGRASVDPGPLRLLGVGLVVGAIGSAPNALLVDKPHLAAFQLTIPVSMMLTAAAAERQRLRGAGGGPRTAENRRPFSVLPYAAVAAVDGLLLVAAWSHGDGAGIVAVAAVALTAAVVFRQITAFRENSQLVARLDFGATHDALTGLPNRALFNARLAAALAGETDRQVGVVLIDLDEFKPVNDTLGHSVGDALLVAVAQRLRAAVRDEDTVARLGGDEFVAIFRDIDPAAADGAIERLLAALATPVVAEGHELLVRVSIGIADGRTGDDPATLLRRADIAMYAAKKAGGNAYDHFRADMVDGLLDHVRLGAELRQALTEDKLFLQYQPIIALDDERVIGVEALVRWAHPAHGTLAAADFLPVAERTGEILPLGGWAVREACRQIRSWDATYAPAAPEVLNVNVSVRELSDRRFVAGVAAVLAETGFEPHRLVIETSETAMVDVAAVVDNLAALRRLGVRISLADFGNGQSALSLLQDWPVDELKLDRACTRTALARPGHSVAAAVIQLAHTFGLHAIAEGVETSEQAEHLEALGYRAAQGDHFAGPLSAIDLGKLLAGAGHIDLAASAALATGGVRR